MSRLVHAALVVIPLLTACPAPDESADDDDTSPAENSPTPEPTPAVTPTSTPSDAPGEGTLAVGFKISERVRLEMEQNQEYPVGTFIGDMYQAEDVSDTGPNSDDVEALASLHVEGIDLREGPSAALYFSDLLPVGNVVILGFLDSDGNADPEAPMPDPGDPVTFPSQNIFTVVGGVESEVMVNFTMLYPEEG